MSLGSLISKKQNKVWLKLFLPSLFVLFGLLGLQLAGDALIQEHPAHSEQNSFFNLRDTQLTSLKSLDPAPHAEKPSESTPETPSEQPLFLISLLTEELAESLELGPAGLLALLGISLGAVTALKKSRSPAWAQMIQVAFSPLAGLQHASVFTWLQIFRL